MTDEGDIPSIQCKMSLREPTLRLSLSLMLLPTVSRPVSLTTTVLLLSVAGLLMGGALSDERTGLSFSGPSPVGLVAIF
jgi:hypothetical protein